MSQPQLPTPESNESNAAGAKKRRRPVERDAPRQSQPAIVEGVSREGSVEGYDPDQDMGERRRLRKGMRDLSRNLNGASLVRKT